MENIIKKAIEGGYDRYGNNFLASEMKLIYSFIVCDPHFWQALGKVCGWIGYCSVCKGIIEDEGDGQCLDCMADTFRAGYINHALRFHEINLTEGWDKAVAYLSELVK